MNDNSLKISNLKVAIDNNIVLENLSMDLDITKVNVLLGPNGAGKSTFANVLMGNPKYRLVEGVIEFDGKDVTTLSADKRAKLGLFLSFQHPVEIEGVNMLNFLKNSYSLLTGKNLNVKEFNELLDKKMTQLSLDSKFKTRFLNHNFSGGEKKKSEILQLLLTVPKFAILDEIDSGLDIDSIKIVGQVLAQLNKEFKIGFLLITHSDKLLKYLDADKVFVLDGKKISKEGSKELLNIVDDLGFSTKS